MKISQRLKIFIHHSQTGLSHGAVLRLFINGTRLSHWWLRLFARALAENKQLLWYEFTLETCENART